MYNRNNDSQSMSQFINGQIPEEDNEDTDQKETAQNGDGSQQQVETQSQKSKLDEDFMFQMDKGNF